MYFKAIFTLLNVSAAMSRVVIKITFQLIICLSRLQEIVKGRKAWHAEVHRVTKSQT